MRPLFLRSTITLLAAVFIAAVGYPQVANNSDQNAVRVTITLNADGSRTSYEFDAAHKKATAVTTTSDGKVREKIKYDLDDSDAAGKLLGKTSAASPSPTPPAHSRK